jgi:hypothetical protein
MRSNRIPPAVFGDVTFAGAGGFESVAVRRERGEVPRQCAGRGCPATRDGCAHRWATGRAGCGSIAAGRG